MALLDPFPYGRAPIQNFDFGGAKSKIKISKSQIWPFFEPHFLETSHNNTEPTRHGSIGKKSGYPLMWLSLDSHSFSKRFWWLEVLEYRSEFRSVFQKSFSSKKVWSKTNLKTNFTLGSKKFYTGVEKKVSKLPRPQPLRTLHLSLWTHFWGKPTPFPYFHFFTLLINWFSFKPQL